MSEVVVGEEPPSPYTIAARKFKVRDDIFLSCKKGDLVNVKYLVEVIEVRINVHDRWDSTPLYYACLCGHMEIVKYLLGRGAVCHPGTFDGERCIYGALTDEIRRTLLDAKLLGRPITEFDQFLEKMMAAEEFSDIMLVFGEKRFKGHRCILTSRCQYFRCLPASHWERSELKIVKDAFGTGDVHDDPLTAEALHLTLRFIYTGTIHCPRYMYSYVLNFSQLFSLTQLRNVLENAEQKALHLELLKPNLRIANLIIDADDVREQLSEDFSILLQYCDSKGSFSRPLFTCDTCLMVDDNRFYCHKAFLCCRSDYFRAIFDDHFSEQSQEIDETNRVPVFVIDDVAASTFRTILHYIYSDKVNTSLIRHEDLLELLDVANMYLLNGLKKTCGSALCNALNVQNVSDMLTLARLHNLDKLEMACTQVMADNIEKMVTLEDFRELVVLDAKEVKDRQATDSIPVIDDIRYHLETKGLADGDLSSSAQKLKIIENFLTQINLEA